MTDDDLIHDLMCRIEELEGLVEEARRLAIMEWGEDSNALHPFREWLSKLKDK